MTKYMISIGILNDKPTVSDFFSFLFFIVEQETELIWFYCLIFKDENKFCQVFFNCLFSLT